MEDLPPEMLESHLNQQDLDLINKPINVPEGIPEPKEKSERDGMGETAVRAVNDVNDMLVSMACIDVAKFAKLDSFDITFDDGRKEKYYRVSPPTYELDEIEDLRTEVEGRLDLTTGKPLTMRDQRLKAQALEQVAVKYYLRNAKTDKPMSDFDRKHVQPGTLIKSIADSCILRSLHHIVSGKN